MSTASHPPQPANDGPIPLSMPAILRNPKNPVSAHLHQPAKAHKSTKSSSQTREHSKRWEGKRWKMRRENDLLSSNPHIHPPNKHDQSLLPSQLSIPTFPSPLPPSLLPRTRPAPSPSPPEFDPSSAEAGTFTLSLKGIRRTLRNRGPRGRELVEIVEKELDAWEEAVGHGRGGVWRFGGRQEQDRGERVIDPFLVPAPQGGEGSASNVGGASGERSLPLQVNPLPMDITIQSFVEGEMVPAIVELARSPASLTWVVPEGFERFVVHCVARHRNLVSFSKTTPFNTRLTYILLRPTKHTSTSLPDRNGLDTPPTTDMSSVGGSGTDSDLPRDGEGFGETGGDWSAWESETDGEADLTVNDSALPPPPPRQLAPPRETHRLAQSTEAHISEADEGDLSSSDDESASSVALLSLASSVASLDLDPPNPGDDPSTPPSPPPTDDQPSLNPTPSPMADPLTQSTRSRPSDQAQSTPRKQSSHLLPHKPTRPSPTSGSPNGELTPRKVSTPSAVTIDSEDEHEGRDDVQATPVPSRRAPVALQKEEAEVEPPKVEERRPDPKEARKKESFWEFLYGPKTKQ